MSVPMIRAADVRKRYRLGAHASYGASLRETLTEWTKSRFKLRRTPGERDFWALSGVSFEVERGSVLGIIGKNGAGKSTILKILSRVTPPTEGRVELRGRVASLLEVGTGFHPELTGRENIYLNGTILGMRKREIDRKFDAIVSFAEVERFIDTPVKRYSSGMYVRLAFAVAAHLEPEILLVDEVLAVGDAQFQKKCLGKMGAVAGEGKTILFVSHNMAAIQRLCNTVLLLDGGRVAGLGSPREMTSRYLAAEPAVFVSNVRTGGPQFLRADLRDERDAPLARPLSTEPFVLRLHYVLPKDAPGTRIGIGVLSPEGMPLFTSDSRDAEVEAPARAGEYVARVSVPADTLVAGEFQISISLWNQHEVFDLQESALSISVDPGPSLLYADGTMRKGFVQVPCGWKIDRE